MPEEKVTAPEGGSQENIEDATDKGVNNDQITEGSQEEFEEIELTPERYQELLDVEQRHKILGREHAIVTKELGDFRKQKSQVPQKEIQAKEPDFENLDVEDPDQVKKALTGMVGTINSLRDELGKKGNLSEEEIEKKVMIKIKNQQIIESDPILKDLDSDVAEAQLGLASEFGRRENEKAGRLLYKNNQEALAGYRQMFGGQKKEITNNELRKVIVKQVKSGGGTVAPGGGGSSGESVVDRVAKMSVREKANFIKNDATPEEKNELRLAASKPEG